MDPKFIFMGFMVFFILSVLSVNFRIASDSTSICTKKFNVTCIKQNECCARNEDCCTEFCHKFLLLDNGRCMDPSVVFFTTTDKTHSVNKCKRFGDNTCKNDHECCSHNCYKEHRGWELGICKKAPDSDTEHSVEVTPNSVDKCKRFGDPTCEKHRECCSHNCYKEHRGWKLGICKKALDSHAEHSMEVKPHSVDKCKRIGDNTCENNDKCCSHNCYKEHSDWKLGVCKMASDIVLAEHERSGMCALYEGPIGSAATANGEPFRPSDATAAHRTLPFNTTVRVDYDGRSAVVRVNDRGPSADRDRLLELSRGAAEGLGIASKGAVPCEVTVLQRGPGTVCKRNWDNTCAAHDECCSGNCDKRAKWAQGVCKPAAAAVAEGTRGAKPLHG